MTGKLIAVRNSLIHGKGVYATQLIKKGLRLIEYKGARKKWSAYDDDGNSGVCLFEIDREFVVDPRINGNEARYINHSCSPNCEAILEESRIYIQAVRKIQIGEEITYKYSLTLGRRPTRSDRKRFICKCGSNKCKGTLLE